MSVSAEQPPDKTKQLVKVSAVVHDSTVKPGDTVQVGVVLDIAKDWHVYWPGQNDGGMPTDIKVLFTKADGGFRAGPVSFPVPKRYVLPGDILDYVFEGKLVVTAPVKVPETAKVGDKVLVGTRVSYLVCKEACLPGDAEVTTTFTIGEKTQPGPDAKVIDDARAAQPKPESEGFDAAATAKWEVTHASDSASPDRPWTLVITAKEKSVTRVTFFPAEGSAKLRDPIKSGEVKGDEAKKGELRLTFEPGGKPVEGIVEIVSGNTSKAWSFRREWPKPPSGGGVPGSTPPAPASVR